ncbi:MAG TPA: hypothetical protein VEU62_06865, partial [Bryobacterales bacterium]|nr:hypothetical protein [Bryobacterales bacterium]
MRRRAWGTRKHASLRQASCRASAARAPKAVMVAGSGNRHARLSPPGVVQGYAVPQRQRPMSVLSSTGRDGMGMERKQFWALLFVFGSLVLASRLPLAPGQLFSFDDVNFAYAIGHFDPRISQPQPPGYPLFVVETRVLRRLRFKRAGSNLLVLSLAGSIAALLALAWLGGEMAGTSAGWCAAWLLLFHHSFWYGALTSAIRVHLALISAAVAAACYRAWKGERRWIYGSAVALGLSAGIRPEMGALLFPLWAVSAMSAARAAKRPREFLRGLALLAAVVLAWLVPTMLASGGPSSYLRLCWNYLAEQSTLTSGLFGAPESKWGASVVWLCVWTLSSLLAWPLAAALAWRRSDGFGFAWSQVVFLALWFVPSLAFAILVHIADAGQALAMVPAVCLVGGCLISRAVSRLEPWMSREHALLFLIVPSLLIDVLVFFRPGWYHQVQPETGWRAAVEQTWADIDSGLDQTSLGQIRRTVSADDHALRALGTLAAERPERTVV